MAMEPDAIQGAVLPIALKTVEAAANVLFPDNIYVIPILVLGMLPKINQGILVVELEPVAVLVQTVGTFVQDLFVRSVPKASDQIIVMWEQIVVPDIQPVPMVQEQVEYKAA